MYDVTQITHSY